MNAVARKKRGFDFVEYKLNALVGMHINKYKEIENRSNWTQSQYQFSTTTNREEYLQIFNK